MWARELMAFSAKYSCYTKGDYKDELLKFKQDIQHTASAQMRSPALRRKYDGVAHQGIFYTCIECDFNKTSDELGKQVRKYFP